MKKFVIISVILLLIGGAAFGFSLKHYIDVKHPAEKQSEEKSSDEDVQENTPETPQSQSATEEPAPQVDPLSSDGIFAGKYDKAKKDVENMSKEDMVGQLIVGICSDLDSGSADIVHYGLAGYLFESDAFSYKSADEIKAGLKELGDGASVKPILAVMEEGGDVTTVSDSGSFSENSYDSPRNILAAGGLQDVEKTELEKANFLKGLGFNLNLAPVVDMADSYDQIMYTRSLSNDPNIVSDFAKYCAKHVQAKGVSVSLKHFPGYGTIPDSANYEAQANGAAVVDDRPADTIRKTDYEPFKAGVKEGVHFVTVSNVVVKNIDSAHTAALSPAIHQELRSAVGFSGLIITDILDDADYSQYADGKNVAVAAILAGNDLVLVRNYADAYNAILAAVNDGTISEDLLRQICTRVLAYKYTAGIIK